MRNRLIAVISVAIVLVSLCAAQIVIKPTPPPNKPTLPHGQAGTTATNNKPAPEPWSAEGKVKDISDPDDKGIPGAVVSVGGKGSYTTDAYGWYKVDGLDRSKGSYMFKVSKAGYTFNPSGATVHPPNQGRISTVNFQGTPTAKPKK